MRFETTYTALAPQLKVVAPWREWNLRSREALLDYLKERNIPTTASLEKITAAMKTLAHLHRRRRAGKPVECAEQRLGYGPSIHRKRRISLSR